jgi:hypothetical protein
MSADRESAAEVLNRACECSVVDLAKVRSRIDAVLDGAPSVIQSHPHLFSATPVFVTPQHFADMQNAIAAIEAVVRAPGYRESALADAPAIARRPVASRGVFFGYDFHVGPDGPRLIEINTNAGGAFFNIAARDAQIACCEGSLDHLMRMPSGTELEDAVVAMFREEWRLARGGAPLRSIAIVDEDPAGQFLHPEFLLARRLFESRGIEARVADVGALQRVGDRIVVDGEPVDLVYNRSTDFYLESVRSTVLRDAYENDLAVVTPHPHAHALYAHKRNLVLLSDPARLEQHGIAPEHVAILARVIPRTREVQGDGEHWWTSRKEWFFKPESGFGSRGAYRGDKLTRRVFADVMKGGYIAQEFTPAGERLQMKADIRCYTYAGAIQLMAARLYQGQTTNFRTAGGGFAPVYVTA